MGSLRLSEGKEGESGSEEKNRSCHEFHAGSFRENHTTKSIQDECPFPSCATASGKRHL